MGLRDSAPQGVWLRVCGFRASGFMLWLRECGLQITVANLDAPTYSAFVQKRDSRNNLSAVIKTTLKSNDSPDVKLIGLDHGSTEPRTTEA